MIVNTEKKTDLISSPLNARTSVQEYGGAAAIAYGGVVYFSNSTDNRVYQVMEGRAAEVITPGVVFIIIPLSLFQPLC